MRYLISLSLLTFFSLQVIAQDETIKDLKKASEKSITKDPKDTTVKIWKKG
jgi:hypothetical protein